MEAPCLSVSLTLMPVSLMHFPHFPHFSLITWRSTLFICFSHADAGQHFPHFSRIMAFVSLTLMPVSFVLFFYHFPHQIPHQMTNPASLESLDFCTLTFST
jgi:hypothetical protein